MPILCISVRADTHAENGQDCKMKILYYLLLIILLHAWSEPVVLYLFPWRATYRHIGWSTEQI